MPVTTKPLATTASDVPTEALVTSQMCRLSLEQALLLDTSTCENKHYELSIGRLNNHDKDLLGAPDGSGCGVQGDSIGTRDGSHHSGGRSRGER